eukprot:gnl/MRDRNA2_/MRDRNA2_202601_c0_seq1.p1 gnl/MRDRNA2_/MRDRNA2_202601_c0~~gnl/MRDRNA2_/MRDRNA2_202601_c0_seq1.p1  ORF type:complete len:239 (-),score=64.03 gnl/MRDRNA2_/MRDRNA2_202601_c0_seq1:138-854(-)
MTGGDQQRGYVSMSQSDGLEEGQSNNRELHQTPASSSPRELHQRPGERVAEKRGEIHDQVMWAKFKFEMLGLTVLLILLIVLVLTEGLEKCFKRMLSHAAEVAFLGGLALMSTGLIRRAVGRHIRDNMKEAGDHFAEELVVHIKQLPKEVETKVVEALQEPLNVLNGLEIKVCGAVHAAEERIRGGFKEVPLEVKKTLDELKDDIQAQFHQAAAKVEDVKEKIHKVHDHIAEKSNRKK